MHPGTSKMQLKKSAVLGALLVATGMAASAQAQMVTLRCSPPEGVLSSVDVDPDHQVVSVCDTGAPPCVQFRARVDQRYVVFGPRNLAGGGCPNCQPMVIDRTTGSIRWVDGSVGQCTRQEKVF